MGDLLDHFTAHQPFFNDLREAEIPLPAEVGSRSAGNAFSALARNGPICRAGRGLDKIIDFIP